MDPNNVEELKEYRDSIHRKRANLMTFLGVMLFLFGFVPLIVSSSFGGGAHGGLISFCVLTSLIALIMIFIGRSKYKKMLATPYIAGAPLFPPGFFGRYAYGQSFGPMHNHGFHHHHNMMAHNHYHSGMGHHGGHHIGHHHH
jgi:hypothetical protein